MLYEIECEKFAKKVNGQLVPRGRIQLREGLNTVLGDKAAQNSIGKSTFLLVVDFCFGGDDYINPKICKAKEKLHSHTINFAFKFGNKIDYFCRSTKTPSEIGICDSEYKVQRIQTLKEFKDYLLKAYDITTPSISFREMVGRFLRIYGRENYAERYPLKYGDVKPESAIETLEKMFNVFAFIEEYKSVYNDKSKRSKVRDDATKLGEMTNVARTKKEYNANEKEIERLRTELQKLMDREDAELSQEETDNLDKASEIKGQLTVLKRRRSRLVSQLNAVKANMSGGLLDQTQIFCSSLPGYDIPVGSDIFDYLRQQFQEYELHVFLIHSKNYYMSAASLNEMGAAWVLRSNCTSFLLPNFRFEDMTGAINGKSIAIKLDNDETEVKDKLNQLYDTVIREFGLTKKAAIVWEAKRDRFIKEVKEIIVPDEEQQEQNDDLELLDSGLLIKKSEKEAGKNIYYCYACYQNTGKLFTVVKGSLARDKFCSNCKMHYSVR